MATKEQPITQALLARAHSPGSAARLFDEKIQHRPIHLRPSSPPPANARDVRRKAHDKQLRRRKKALKPKPISATQRRKLGLYKIPPAGQKYALFEPLHRLWLGYVREVLGREIYTGGEAAAAKLTSADFHGAQIAVVRSGCVGRVGIQGIVVKDSRFALEIITQKNKLKLVPKEGTVFRVEIPLAEAQVESNGKPEGDSGPSTDHKKDAKLVLEIHGDQFTYRPADRANRKFKPHFSQTL